MQLFPAWLLVGQATVVVWWDVNPLPKNAAKGFWKVDNEPGATWAGQDGFPEAVLVLFCAH